METTSTSYLDALSQKPKTLAYDMIDTWMTNNTGKTFSTRKYTQNLQMSLRSNPAFRATFPKLREFIQNATDYLGLTDDIGRRFSSVEMFSTKPRDMMYKVGMRVGGSDILTFAAKRPDCLVIKQHFTYPLHPSVIKLGVVDVAKATGNSAGGFGYMAPPLSPLPPPSPPRLSLIQNVCCSLSGPPAAE